MWALALLLWLPGVAGASVIYVQPLGEALPATDVAAVEKALVAFYAVSVKVLPREALPGAAYYPARKRWRADRLLDWLGPRMPADGARILGLLAADISTTNGKYPDWGVLGLATIDGRAGVISTFRCRKKATSEAHARIRLAKVAVHEIGHALGLEHCPTRGCLMEDAEGKVATTDREYDLCARCRGALARSGHKIPAAPEIPWPRP